MNSTKVDELNQSRWIQPKSSILIKVFESTKVSQLNQSVWTQPKLKLTKDSALYELSQSVWFQSKFFLSQPKSLQSTNVSELKIIEKFQKIKKSFKKKMKKKISNVFWIKSFFSNFQKKKF